MALFSREDFLQVDIPGLIQNIWSLSDHSACPHFTLSLNYNIDALKQKWTDKYIDFYFLIDVLTKKDIISFYFDVISDTEKNNL